MSVTRACLVVVCLVDPVFCQGQNETSSFSLLSRALEQCSSDPQLFACLKVKAVKLLDRALVVDSLPVSDFMSLVRNHPAGDEGSAPLETTFPRDLDENNSTLDHMIQERLQRFLETRTIQLRMPKDVFEGRHKVYKKGGKGGGLLVVFGMFAAMMLQLAYGKIALVAGKALLLGKVALLIAGVVGLKSLLSQHAEHPHPPQVIVAEPEHHLGWARSAGDGQDLAYRSHRRSLKH